MGIAFTRLFAWNKQVRIVFLGLCGAGQTTIFNRLCTSQELVSTVPTIGFDVETVRYKNLKFVAVDVGRYFWNLYLHPHSDTTTRPSDLWRFWCPDTRAIIYVVDSSPTEKHRLVYAKEDIRDILGEEELKGAILLIFANKQDVPGAVDEAAISEALELHKIENRCWAMFKTCAVRGEGIWEGFDWLSDALQSAGDV